MQGRRSEKEFWYRSKDKIKYGVEAAAVFETEAAVVTLKDCGDIGGSAGAGKLFQPSYPEVGDSRDGVRGRFSPYSEMILVIASLTIC